VFIESYIDESGIHEGAVVCVVAGYYGTRSAWDKFEPEWRRVLRDHGIEQVGFHAKRFWKKVREGKRIERVSPYRGWSDDKADKFIERLVQTVARNRIFPFGYGVVVDDWKALPLNVRRFLTGASHTKGRFTSSGSPNRSYYLPFAFSVAASLAHSGATETAKKVHFFVGLDRSWSGYAKEMYYGIARDQRVGPMFRHLLGTISFPLSKDTPELQAADLLAYRLYSDYLAFIRKAKRMPRITKLLAKNRRQNFELFDAEKLLEIVEQYKAEALADMGKLPKFLIE